MNLSVNFVRFAVEDSNLLVTRDDMTDNDGQLWATGSMEDVTAVVEWLNQLDREVVREDGASVLRLGDNVVGYVATNDNAGSVMLTFTAPQHLS